jgi:hypothetical protein
MYFATGAARALSSAPPGPNIPEGLLLAIAVNSRRSLFCTLTARSAAVWRLRVSHAFASAWIPLRRVLKAFF